MRSSSARRAENSNGGSSRLRSFVRGLQVCVLLGMSAACGVAIAFFISSSKMIPADMTTYEAPEATIIYSSDLKVLGRLYQENRTNVPLKDIPDTLREATVAIEDSRFYTHSGIDIHGIARAIWKNLLRQRFSEGASTITQQLARNVYLTRDKSIQRKAQEVIIAILMERKFTKEKILELYMNQIYYGSGSFGVQAASRVYFGKDVKELNLSESAMIAGMPQKPSGYSPHEDIEAATGRRDVVLNRMAELGYITPERRDQAKGQKLRIIPRASGRNVYTAPHFVDYVSKQLRERYGDAVLYKGLRVYTTLNYDMQMAAETALRKGVKRQERAHRVTEGCFIAIEPGNGYIRAMVGSVNPKSDWNRCVQSHRQPGSCFKPIVYTAALMDGMRPSDTISNQPYHSRDGKWKPKNYTDDYCSSVTLKRAIAQSMNAAAIRVAEKVGINNVIKYANLMGVGLEPDYQLEPYLTIAIGGCRGVRPLDMASAYCTFANDGVYVPSTAIIRVTKSNGDPIEDYVPEGRRVIPSDINKMMDEDMLRGVVLNGTGRRASSIRNARGKTGTTNDGKDAWWIGYVPNKLVAACWVGNDNNKPMNDASGSGLCTPVWVEFMKKSLPIFDKLHKDDKVPAPKKTEKKPAKPSSTASDPVNSDPEKPVTIADENADSISVTLCDQSRRLATENCPSTHSEQYIRGQEPKSYCDVHTARRTTEGRTGNSSDTTYVTVNVCSDSGMLAGTGCPSTVRKRFPVDSVPSQECTQHSTR